MKPTAALQEKLYDEMLSRIQQTDTNVPYRERGHFYYSRTEEGKQYPIYARKKGSLDAPEQVILDVNRLAEGKQFMSVGEMKVSPDENLLAYTTDDTGFRQYTLRVKDLRTGKDGPEAIPRVTVGGVERGRIDAFLQRRGRADQAQPPGLPPRAGGGEGRPPLRREGRALQRLRVEVAGPQAAVRGGGQPHLHRGPVLPRRPAAGGDDDDLAARGRPPVRRRPPRRHLLDPHQRQGSQLSPGHGAGVRSLTRELEGGPAPSRRR